MARELILARGARLAISRDGDKQKIAPKPLATYLSTEFAAQELLSSAVVFRSLPMEPTAALPTRFKMDDDREEVRVAITQMECHPCPYENVRVAEKLVRVAAASGADVVLLQELFANRYFCQEQTERAFIFAKSEEESPLLKTFQRLAKELAVVSRVSWKFMRVWQDQRVFPHTCFGGILSGAVLLEIKRKLFI